MAAAIVYAFKRDYARFQSSPDAPTVLAQYLYWFENDTERRFHRDCG